MRYNAHQKTWHEKGGSIFPHAQSDFHYQAKMNTIILALEGLILVTCFFRAVDGFSPYMTKPKGDVSGPDDRQIKVKNEL